MLSTAKAITSRVAHEVTITVFVARVVAHSLYQDARHVYGWARFLSAF